MAENFSKRDTIVVEWQYPEEVGSGEEGYKKTVDYINTLFESLNVPVLKSADAHPHSYQPKIDAQSSIPSAMPEPKAHLCGKYGFAGFGTGENGVYGHAYFWDKHAPNYEAEPPFGTIDVSFPEVMSKKVTPEKIIDHTRQFFNPERIVWKSTQEPDRMNDFIDLAPHILRQRLLIQGILLDEIDEKKVSKSLDDLCVLLKMGKLSIPEVYESFAFMHWEDSGVVASWNKEIFNIDIYTCKGFEVEKAVDFIRGKIEQKIFKIKEI